jgi:cytochrome c oxidase assembly protein subunit 15
MGLPEILVGIHMVLACVLAAVMTVTVLSLKSTASVRAETVPVEVVRAS